VWLIAFRLNTMNTANLDVGIAASACVLAFFGLLPTNLKILYDFSRDDEEQPKSPTQDKGALTKGGSQDCDFIYRDERAGLTIEIRHR